ncbi:MAG: lipid-A-disaccharide synthase N-terminal domain-containing protein [Phycisphaerales bacterium]|jgi:lipid-A-disaccharide synthase-like uncharacterized protein|nr:lipid-A-disaccharide synthase N-terminal domain-containing protein [Phycisphaerales bacterium]
MKPGPIVAMVLLVLLGMWLVWARPGVHSDLDVRPGAFVQDIRVGASKGLVEVLNEAPGGTSSEAGSEAVPGAGALPGAGTLPGGASFRVLLNGHASPEMTREEFERAFGPAVTTQLLERRDNAVFRLLNITGWASLAWVALGLGGQIVFSCRFLIQWIVSEKQRQSVIPTAFWWISLLGGVCLFTYFVWRRDLVGVLGQSTGIVIYARNLRLISKQKRREARKRATDVGDETP